MPSGKGVTINVTAETDAGKRRHMEDYLAVSLAPNETLKEIPGLKDQAFVGVFDGHGGKEAAMYARERLWDLIQEQRKFRTTDRQKVVEAIADAYWNLHKEMEPMRETWKPNKLGDLSTAGTTACTVIFRQDHFYVANVGDSSAVLATVNNDKAGEDGKPPLLATMLSRDHKPDDPTEVERVERLGGQVKISRKGVPRVVWERKKRSDDPDKPPTVDFIPFLSVSRSLGDFWSWNERTQQFVVSPHPDVFIHPLDPSQQRFLVLASDGLWNVMSPQEVVDFVWRYETSEDTGDPEQEKDVVRALIDEALYRWRSRGMFADNISVVIAFLSQEGAQAGTPVTSSVSSRACEGAVAGPESERRAMAEGSGCSEGLSPEGWVSLPHRESPRADEEEEIERPAKRARGLADEEMTSELAQHDCPPRKKSRQERDSGCESDSGSPVTESGDSCVPSSTAALAGDSSLPPTATSSQSHAVVV